MPLTPDVAGRCVARLRGRVEKVACGASFTLAICRKQVNPKPGTRNPKPETRNPKTETRNPKPETRNPKPETRYPKPETRHPKPETRNPKH